MVVPLIFGKIAKDLVDALRAGEPLTAEGFEWQLLVGFLCAFVTGLIACVWMIKLVKSSKLSYFSYYCFARCDIGHHRVGIFISCIENRGAETVIRKF